MKNNKFIKRKYGDNKMMKKKDSNDKFILYVAIHSAFTAITDLFKDE